MPTNASSPDFTNILAGIGISNASPGDIQVALSNWNAQIAAQAVSETLSFPTAGPVGPPYFPPGTPHCPDPAKKYAFGGRDIVFVHGLQLDHLAAKIAGNPRASANWVTPTQFPGSLQNPEFYDGGYFKGVDLTNPREAADKLAIGTRVVTTFAEHRKGDVLDFWFEVA